MRLAFGLTLAVAAAVALNWGWIEQHAAASTLPPLALRRPLRSVRLLFGDLSWLVGFLTGIGGWALYVAALVFAPLSLVQAVSAGGVAVLAVFARRSGATLGRREWTAVAVAGLGLLLLAVSLAHGGAGGRHASWPALAVSLAVCVVVAAAVAGATTARLAGGAALGIAAGILYAAGDVATKGAVAGGIALVLVPVVLTLHGGAFASLQLGFQRGEALATAGVSTLLMNALPIAAGITLFHEPLPGGGLGAVRVVAFAAVVLGAGLLAWPPALEVEAPADQGPEDEEPGQVERRRELLGGVEEHLPDGDLDQHGVVAPVQRVEQ